MMSFLNTRLYTLQVMYQTHTKTTKDYFVEKPADGDLYGIPRVIDVTEYYPNDYRVGFGIQTCKI